MPRSPSTRQYPGNCVAPGCIRQINWPRSSLCDLHYRRRLLTGELGDGGLVYATECGCCGVPIAPPRRKFCSTRCAENAFHGRCGDLPLCAFCGHERVAKRGARYCSSTCVQRASRLRNEYGITPEQYLLMLVEQGNACAACRRPFIEERPPLVDHDHATGEVRGLLDGQCNTAIGLVGEELDRLRGLVAYLEAQP